LHQAVSAPTVVAPSRVGQLSIDVAQGSRIHVGSEITIVASSSVPGVLVIGVINTDGKLTQLFPNKLSGMDRVGGLVRPGERTMIGDSNAAFAFCAAEPVGSGDILGFVIPPTADLNNFLNENIDLQPIDNPGGWFRKLTSIAQASKDSDGLPTKSAFADRHFEVVERRQ
jgi:hypothetical protein